MKIITTILGLMVAVLIIAVAVIPITNSIAHDEGNTIDILLIDGQSNGAYYTNNTSRCDPALVDDVLGEPTHKALYYGTADGSSRVVTENTEIREMYRDGEWKIGGEESGLAYYLMSKNHRDVLVLNIAKGGTGIEELATGEVWTDGKEVIETALAEIDSIYDDKNILGWVMIHGEQDKNQTIAYYEEYFIILKDNLSDLGFEECYLVLPRYSQSLNSYDAMIDLAKQYKDIHTTKVTETFTVSNGLLNNDNLHYTQMGRLVISEKVVAMIPTNANYENDYAALIQTIPIIMIGSLMVCVAGTIVMRNQD